MTGSERRWALWFAIGMSFLTTLPYLIGFAAAGQNWRYSGLLIAAEDGNSYLAKMALGAAGDWLFRTPYTAVPQNGFLAFLPYLLLGKLAAPPGQYEQLVVLFHLLRIGGTIFLTFATYRFISLFLAEIYLRRLAVVLAMLGGGLGFLAPFGLGGLWQGIMKLPLEFYSPETFGFLSPLAFPHLTWARTFLLLGFVYFFESEGERTWRASLKTGLAWWGVGLMQPLTVVSAWAVVGFYLLVWAAWLAIGKKDTWTVWLQSLRRVFWAGLISCPIVIYNILSFQLDPFLKRWQAQNLIPSPPLGDYLLAFGIVIPLILWGCFRWKQFYAPRLAFPLTWLAAFPLLAYAPYNLQRRLPDGIWVALIVLAVSALAVVPQRWRKAALAWLSLSLLSSLFLYIGGILAVSHPQLPLFRPLEEIKAMDFLAGTAQKGDVVLAAYDTCNVLPTRAVVKVIIGHGPESLGLAEIQPRVEAFYRSTTTDTMRLTLLKQYGVRFVFLGPLEKDLGNWDPSTFPALRLVYSKAGYEIFEVLAPPNP